MSYLIDNAEEMQKEWFDGVQTVGVTAGASAPEILIDQVLQRLQQWGGLLPQELAGRAKHMVFSLPRELRVVNIE